MNRPIKFRAWTKLSRQMVQVSELNLGWETGGADVYYYHPESGRQHLHRHGIELMQFTGLLDKNGKEIFEGDILFNEIRNGVVRWDEKWMGWASSKIHKMVGDGVYTVIGNIYENPDLIKSGEGDIM